MRNYYYLGISLPELEILSKPLIRFEELIEAFKINLSKNEMASVEKIQIYYDLINLEKTLLGEPITHKGNMTSQEILEALKLRQGFPEFVFEFFDRYKVDSEQLEKFSELYSLYFHEYAGENDPSAIILQYEKELRSFLLGYRAVRFKRSIEKEFSLENIEDRDIHLILSKEADTKVLNEEKLQKFLEKIDPIQDPLEIRSSVASFRFEHYKEIQDFHPFTIQGLLAYMMQLIILEELEVKSPEMGLEIFNNLLKDKNEYVN